MQEVTPNRFRFEVEDENRKLAFWLLPAAPAKQFLRSLIDDLAARYDAPSFEPHLTLGSTDFDGRFDFARLDRMQLPDSIELQVDCIQHSEKYTKTVFVRFQSTNDLLALRTTVSGETTDDFEPHLSLIYKTMPAEMREELARRIDLPIARVRFDGINAISTAVPLKSAEQIKAWQSLWQRNLGQ